VVEEPFNKLINQGMIQGRSNFVYRIKDTNTFVSLGLKDKYDTTPLHVDVNIVSNDILDLDAFRAWRPEYADAQFELEDGKYICGWAVEKMSKSMFNVVNPDTIIEKYGADTLRIYEMFLGPLEQSKPWDTNGIDGCHRFIRKMWNLFFDNRNGELIVTDETPSKDELKSIHKVIKKVSEDVENFSYNTSVSAFMICVNELTSLKSHNKQVLDILVRLAAPFMPHIAEELWHTLGHNDSVCNSEWPVCNEEYLKEDSITYSISFNGKTRFTMDFPAEATAQEIQDAVLSNEKAISYIDGKAIRKVIVVPKKIVNVVI
jgi:leucyl-tRNA synthetase